MIIDEIRIKTPRTDPSMNYFRRVIFFSIMKDDKHNYLFAHPM